MSGFSHSIEVPAKLVGVTMTDNVMGKEGGNGVKPTEAEREEEPAMHEAVTGKG